MVLSPFYHKFINFRLGEAQSLFNLFIGAHVDIVMKLNEYMNDDEDEEGGDTQLAMLKVV